MAGFPNPNAYLLFASSSLFRLHYFHNIDAFIGQSEIRLQTIAGYRHISKSLDISTLPELISKSTQNNKTFS